MNLTLLNYLFSINNIPIFILEKSGKMLYKNINQTGVRKDEELEGVFEYFVKNAKIEPTLYLINGIEQFCFFEFDKEQKKYVCGIGSVFLENPLQTNQSKKRFAIDYIYTAERAKEIVMLTQSTSVEEFVVFCKVILEEFQGKSYDVELLLTKTEALSLRDVISKGVTDKIFKIREEIEVPIHDYDMEQRYLDCVRNGDIEKLETLPQLNVFSIKTKLSVNPFKQFLYEMVALVTLATRASIESGVDKETAYTMSDLYIRRLDETKDTNGLLACSRNILYDFAYKVREQKIQSKKSGNVHIENSIKYIRKNLHAKLTLEEIARAVSLDSKYLSRLFIKETSMKLTAYINRERILEAKSLLDYSDFSIIEISNFLAFSSQSYFTKIFYKFVGETPQQYRDKKSVKKR